MINSETRQADATSVHLSCPITSLRRGIMTPSNISIPIKAEARVRAGDILPSQQMPKLLGELKAYELLMFVHGLNLVVSFVCGEKENSWGVIHLS